MTEHPLLAALARAGMKMGLARMRSYLEWLGNPHLQYPVIHVAGTNGKGSVCRMVGAILEEQGFKVGITTSPHLQEVNERIRIGTVPISDADLDSLLRRMDTVRRAWASAVVGPTEAFPLTYFEFSTAAAFQHFADQKVDVAVVEVGMGGRLDASNVCTPLATAIVSVGLDHTEQLGPDHSSIAAEKAGILKAGIPAVIGPLNNQALAVVRAVAAERQVPLYLYGDNYQALGSTDSFRYQGEGVVRDCLRLGLHGDHQVHNAAVALRLIDLLPSSLRCDEGAIRRGLARAENSGRLEWVAPDLLLDGAHNPDGAQVLAHYLARLPKDRPRVLLLGGGTDKDIRSVATILAPAVDRIVATAGTHAKARSPENVVAELAGLPVESGGMVGDALKLHRNGKNLVILAGSLYLVGEARGLVVTGPA